ncbi:MAG: Rqc2 family fibronectin-binding protein [Eubacteriales bacterium]
MPFDGYTTFSVVQELREKLLLGKINKIYQPESDEIILNVHHKGKRYNVLISANNNHPRVHLTDKTKENPQQPPMFCMLLRKNLNNAIILDIKQFQFDRIIEISLNTKNELGDDVTKILIVEIMSRHSNIILMNENQVIIESIKRVSKNISSYREVLPGKMYVYPPQNKMNAAYITQNALTNFLSNYPKNKNMHKFLMDTFMGVSPAMAHEICHRSKISSDVIIECISQDDIKSVYKVLSSLMEYLSAELKPLLYTNENKSKIYDFSAIEYTYYQGYKSILYSSISLLLEDYYYLKDNVSRIKNKASQILQNLQIKLERNYNKLNKQLEELQKSIDSQVFQVYGELLTSHIYEIKKGQDTAKLLNYYTDEEVEIPLSVQLTPSENAQNYYKKYNKGKRAKNYLDEQIKITKEEIYYLESQIDNIHKCTELEEFNEIKEELMEHGYIHGNGKLKKKKKTDEISQPMHFQYCNVDIFVGKNNKQNEYLSLKFASKNDVWLHVKDIPGSHVIIKMDIENSNEDVLQKAALLASYYSKGKNSENVPVDYTAVKYVKKPKGAKTGMVIYTDQKTLFVTPSEEEILCIHRIES